MFFIVPASLVRKICLIIGFTVLDGKNPQHGYRSYVWYSGSDWDRNKCLTNVQKVYGRCVYRPVPLPDTPLVDVPLADFLHPEVLLLLDLPLLDVLAEVPQSLDLEPMDPEVAE
jgi:hypothetical protein